MAATIAIATGYDHNRVKRTHRLGSRQARGEANTWRTFAQVTIMPDGSGYVTVERDGVKLIDKEWGPEDE
jgi:hypothetical protein